MKSNIFYHISPSKQTCQTNIYLECYNIKLKKYSVFYPNAHYRLVLYGSFFKLETKNPNVLNI